MDEGNIALATLVFGFVIWYGIHRWFEYAYDKGPLIEVPDPQDDADDESPTQESGDVSEEQAWTIAYNIVKPEKQSRSQWINWMKRTKSMNGYEALAAVSPAPETLSTSEA